MLTRRALLAAAAAAPLLPVSAQTSPLRSFIPEESSLCGAAHASGRLYGCATANYELQRSDFRPVLLREAGVIVPEYEMKRDALEPAPGRYDFSAADRLVQFAEDHGLAFRGHTLVWHLSNPPWLEDLVRRRRDERLFTAHIAQVMGRYRGRIGSWDVINEVLSPADGRADNLRDSFWLQTFGPGYIDTALHAARAADPSAQLVYNDWGCEQAGPFYDRFRAATLKFLEGLKARAVPIDALGLQGHLAAFRGGIDAGALSRFLNEVKAMGLRILVTELDVDDGRGPLDIAVRDGSVADAAARFLDVVLANEAVDQVLTWGLSDRFLRQPTFEERLIGYRPRTLPLDYTFQRTAMWHAMRRAFAGVRA